MAKRGKCWACDKRRVLVADGLCRDCNTLDTFLHFTRNMIVLHLLLSNPEFLDRIDQRIRKALEYAYES